MWIPSLNPGFQGSPPKHTSPSLIGLTHQSQRGIRPVTATFTSLSFNQAFLRNLLPRGKSTCSFQTRTTWEPRTYSSTDHSRIMFSGQGRREDTTVHGRLRTRLHHGGDRQDEGRYQSGCSQSSTAFDLLMPTGRVVPSCLMGIP